MGSLLIKLKTTRISQEQWFLISSMVVSLGNYVYNLLVGRLLGPEKFADAAVLITFLLIFSFLAMTFQLTAAKFAAALPEAKYAALQQRMDILSLALGTLSGVLIYLYSSNLSHIFHTSSEDLFKVFSLGMPLYFIMSVRRGKEQGMTNFKTLSLSYQFEMMGRLIVTVLLLTLFPIDGVLMVSIGIVSSLIIGLVPLKIHKLQFKNTFKLSPKIVKQTSLFFSITLLYELSQIIINNSDLLLVKHYFPAQESGLYASMAIIGRMVYFIAWMFVMMLLPKVIHLKKAGENTTPILFKYLSYITLLCLLIIIIMAVFPETMVTVLFGTEYLSIAPLLWQYAVAVSLFAISNIFAYYFLSLEIFAPLYFSIAAGIFQITTLFFFHSSLEIVVVQQIAIMALLLLSQWIFFYRYNSKTAII